MDLGEIALVEERDLDLPRLDQLADGRGAQRRDPIQALDRFDLIADPGFGDHAPISHQHHARELEAMAQLFDLGSERLGIGRIPVKHLHGHRTSRSVTQEPKDDLQPGLHGRNASGRYRMNLSFFPSRE